MKTIKNIAFGVAVSLIIAILAYPHIAAYIPVSNFYDSISNEYAKIDKVGNLRTTHLKRIFGTAFGNSVDTVFNYTITNANGGTTTATLAVCSIATNTTANGSSILLSKGKIRTMSGRSNLFRAVARFNNTGVTSNVRELGIYSDANNSFFFRLSGTTFSTVIKRNGVETVVNSGSFNGNGLSSGGTWTVDTAFHSFEIMYLSSAIEFIIDDRAIHTFTPSSQSLTGSLVGQLYASSTNSGGITSNNRLELLSWSGNNIGDAINNPLYYHINAVAETRTLKAGGGTLQSISVGRSGGNGATITLYDNASAGSGTIIGIFDLNNVSSVGNHVFGIEGVNFQNGLTYTTSGTMASASATIFWE